MASSILKITDLADKLGWACEAAGCVADAIGVQDRDCCFQLALQFIVDQMRTIIDEIQSEAAAAAKQDQR